MPSVHLESDDGVSIRLVDVDGTPDDITPIIDGLAATGAVVIAAPSGAQIGAVSRTDFDDPEITAVHDVVLAALTEFEPTDTFDGSAHGVTVLDPVEFSRLAVHDDLGVLVTFDLRPDVVWDFASGMPSPGLRDYWLNGEGAAKIRWGTEGDFRRCVTHLREHVGSNAEGTCANLHRDATGMWPGDKRNPGMALTDTEAFALTQLADSGGKTGVLVVAIPEGAGEAVYGDGDTAPLHQTLIYVGKIDQLDIGDAVALVDAGQRLADEFAPFTARVAGKGILGPDRVDVVITESVSLQAMHDRLLDDPTIAAMYAERNDHPTWVSHVTGLDADVGDEISYHSVAVWIGDDRHEWPLTGVAEFRYNPFQRRAPKGTSIGGRWIDDDSGPTLGQVYPDRSPHRTPEETLWQQRSQIARARQIIVPTREDRESRSGELFGKGAAVDNETALDALFPNGALVTTAPFRSASRTRGEPLFDQELVDRALADARLLRPVDPRVLHSTQPSVTREGVRYYLGQEYDRTGVTFADQFDRGNINPVVYKNKRGQYIILSGHHRAAAALLRGRTLDAIVIDPDEGLPPRRVRMAAATESLSDSTVAPITTLGSNMYRDVTPLLAIDEEFTRPASPAAAATAIRRGNLAIVASPDDAVTTLVTLGSTRQHATWLVAESGPDPAPTVKFAGRRTEFHLKGTQHDHDQSTHARGGSGGDGTAKLPKFSDEMMSWADTLGASIPVPSREELLRYDPVPGTTENEQILLQHLEADGKLSPQRRDVHNTLILESLTDDDGNPLPSKAEGEKQAVVMGGGPASGKSVSLKLGFVDKPPDAAEINPDEFKVLLPESRGKSKAGKEGNGLADQHKQEWASIQHEESSHIGKRAIQGALDADLNIVIDKVQSSATKAVAQVRELQENGYQVQVAFVTTDIDRAVASAITRGEEKGRFVEERIVREGHVGANHAYLAVARDTDVEAQLLTTYPELPDGSKVPPVRTATSTGSGGLRIHDRSAWNEYVARLPPEGVALLDEMDLIFD